MSDHSRDESANGDRPSGNGDSDSSDDGSDTRRWRRIAAVGAGGALLAIGLRRRSLAGAAATLAGGWLLYRAVGGSSAEPVTVERSITVGAPADELAEFWRDPEHLDRIAGPAADVADAGEDRLRWTVRGPFGRTLSVETELAEERPGELLRWEAVEGAPVSGEGSVRFRPAPGDRGTEVTLGVEVSPPGGQFGGAAVDRLGVVPAAVANEALRRFKRYVETGEIPTLERNPSARGSSDLV